MSWNILRSKERVDRLEKIKSNSASDEDVKKQLLNNILKAKTFLPGGDMPGKLKRKRKRAILKGTWQIMLLCKAAPVLPLWLPQEANFATFTR